MQVSEGEVKEFYPEAVQREKRRTTEYSLRMLEDNKRHKPGLNDCSRRREWREWHRNKKKLRIFQN